MDFNELKAELLKDDRIIKAIKRAYHARQYLDPICFPGDIQNCDELKIIECVNRCIRYNKKIKHSELGVIKIPKNRKQNRVFYYTPFINYVVKFLISEYIFEKSSVSKKVFGGNKEIFSNPKGDVFRFSVIQFRAWQKRELKNKAYKWIVIADITKFYDSISSETLAQKISDIINVDCDYRFKAFIKRFYNSLSIGDWCDHYIQNIYFSKLDKALSNSKWSYGRMTDDIRVFCRNIEEAEEAYSLIEKEIAKIKLAINTDKLFIINPEWKLEESVYRYSIKEPSGSFNENVQKYKYSPYIPIAHISNYSKQNLWKIVRDSGNWAIDYENYFFEKELPKNITLLDEIDGKYGFKHEEDDLNTIVDEIEKSKYKQSEEALEALQLFIKYGFGNYRFYYRLIYTYLCLLYNYDKSKITNKFSKTFFYDSWTAVGSIHFYYLAKILFIDHISLLESLNKKFDGFIVNVIVKLGDFAVVSDDGYRNYLWYVLTNIYVPNDSIKLDCKKEDFWIQRLKEFFNNENIEHYSINNYLVFLQKKFPNSNMVSFYFAEYYYYSCHYDWALQKYEPIMFDSQLIEDFSINHRIGTSYEMLGDYENALKYYDLEIELNNNSDTYNNRAVLNLMTDNFELAESDLNKAITIKERFEYFYNLAGLKFLKKCYKSAIDYLERSMQLSNYKWEHDEANLYELLAILYIKDKQYEKSIEAAKKYIEYAESGFFNDYYDKLINTPLDKWKFKRTFY
jgi:hypothetical protein